MTSELTITDSRQIKKLYTECQKIITGWNENNPDSEVRLSAALKYFRGDRLTLSILIEAELQPLDSCKGVRVSLLKIWFDPKEYSFFGTFPSLPFLGTGTKVPFTLDKLQDWLQDFNP